MKRHSHRIRMVPSCSPFHLASIHSASHQTTQMRMSLFRLRKKKPISPGWTMSLLPKIFFLECKINRSKIHSHPKNNQNQQPQTGKQSDEQQNQESQLNEEAQAEEVNALYERLLQEMESQRKNLSDEKQRVLGIVPNGRDY